MGSLTQNATALLWLTVGIGAVIMVVRNPPKANALLGAGSTMITGITHGLESGNIQ